MKLKSLLFVCLMGLFVTSFAGNRHAPVYNEQAIAKSATKKVQMPGPCQIEVINQSDYLLKVDGEVSDVYGIIGIVDTFSIPVYDAPHIIELRGANGYCPYGMYVHIRKSGWFSDYIAYDRFTYPGTSIVIR